MSQDDKKNELPTDTGWSRPIDVTANDTEAQGRIAPITGKEAQPCCMCRSWEHDKKKLIEHLLSMGLEVAPDGSFVTPIVKDVPGRISLKIHPDRYGYCRLQGHVTEDLATCERWEPVRFASELASRIKR